MLSECYQTLHNFFPCYILDNVTRQSFQQLKSKLTGYHDKNILEWCFKYLFAIANERMIRRLLSVKFNSKRCCRNVVAGECIGYPESKIYLAIAKYWDIWYNFTELIYFCCQVFWSRFKNNLYFRCVNTFWSITELKVLVKVYSYVKSIWILKELLRRISAFTWTVKIWMSWENRSSYSFISNASPDLANPSNIATIFSAHFFIMLIIWYKDKMLRVSLFIILKC